ncbi:MAG: hypothetical protein NZ455_11030 [Bacteroidia bacterium]|nr:hypothetical protein [Bacteroidia bacterium]MDW8347018.1 hypothetical protein [Bacteroidia bacterium]
MLQIIGKVIMAIGFGVCGIGLIDSLFFYNDKNLLPYLGIGLLIFMIGNIIAKKGTK